MGNADLVSTRHTYIEALLDDPMIMLIMAVDRIERDDARHLFHAVANRIASGDLRETPRGLAQQDEGIFFQRQGCGAPEYSAAS